MGTYTPGPIEPVDQPADTAPPFAADVYRLEDINFAVDAPAAVSDWFDRKGYVPVVGHLADVSIRGTLVPTGGGRHRLYLNGPMRDAAGLVEGDTVDVVLWLDPDPREQNIPDDLVDALTAADVLDAFNGWPPSHRLEYLRAIDGAKRPETRAKYIDQAVAAARER